MSTFLYFSERYRPYIINVGVPAINIQCKGTASTFGLVNIICFIPYLIADHIIQLNCLQKKNDGGMNLNANVLLIKNDLDEDPKM